MPGTLSPTSVSTKLQRIAELARRSPSTALTALAHHIDVDFLREAYRRTRKDGAPSVDRQTAEEYAQNLEANLQELLDRFKSGTYRAPPVKRVAIPEGDGRRPAPSGGRSLRGYMVLKRQTAQGRRHRALKAGGAVVSGESAPVDRRAATQREPSSCGGTTGTTASPVTSVRWRASSGESSPSGASGSTAARRK